MKFVKYNNATGNIITFYTPDIHTNIPTGTMQISDAVWQNIIDGNCQYKVDLSKISGITAEVDNLADLFIAIVPTPPTLADVKNSKIQEMANTYNTTIINTFQSSAFDNETIETYSCSLADQQRINGEVTMAIANLQGFSSEPISWKNANQTQCVTWQPKNMITLGTDLHKFITQQSDYLEVLTVYINSLTNIDDVNKVTWGMTIPTTTSTATTS